MSKTLVILGNGFDIDLGWKTSYKDVFSHSIMKNALERFKGNVFVNDLVEGECWYDFEGYLRTCIESLRADEVDELNFFWILCRNNILNYFNFQTTQDYIYDTNTNSCAFYFLERLRGNAIYSFNYTNPFTKNNISELPIIYVHGELDGAFTGAEIKVGVDKSINNPLIQNNKISPIIKTNDGDKVFRLIKAINLSNTIIIYGHSLGITDSDYFKPVFNDMIEGKMNGKKVFVVTRDENSLIAIAKNTDTYGVSYDRLILSNNDFRHVYTSCGTSDHEFNKMISEL